MSITGFCHHCATVLKPLLICENDEFLCVSKTVKGSGEMLPQKILKIRMLILAGNEF